MEIKITCKANDVMPLESLVHFQGNLKDLSEKNFEKIKNVILKHGFCEPISVWKHDGKIFILNGHQRVRTLTKMKEEGAIIPKLPVNIVEAKDIKEAKEKVLALTSQYGNMTKDGLYEFMSDADLDFDDIEGQFRFPEIKMHDFKAEFFEEPIEQDEIPTPLAEPITETGDIWLLGRHRLMCGDSTSVIDIDKLLQKNPAQFCFSSPPYNAGKSPRLEQSDRDKNKYLNHDDDQEQQVWADLINDSLGLMLTSCEYVLYNIQMLAGNKTAFLNFLGEFSDHIADIAVWTKSGEPAMAEQVMNSSFEFMIFLKNEKDPKRTIKSSSFNRGTISNVFSFEKKTRNEFSKLHAATFPLELAAFIVKNFTKENDKVVDNFTGTGTTMIACEKLNRQFFGIEKDPVYCDIAVMRWEKATGKKAQKL